MRWVVPLMSLAAMTACRRDAATSEIHADPAREASAPESHDKLAVRAVKVDVEGPFEIHLSFPRIDLPSGAGRAISATIEDDVRRRAQLLRDRWASKPRDEGALGSYRMSCTPAVVANDLVSVMCRGALNDGQWTMDLASYVWTVEAGAPRSLTIADVVGSAKMTFLAGQVSTQLSKMVASSSVFPAKDLVARHALDSWWVQREGLAFDFLPGSVSSVQDELYAGVAWTPLRAMAKDPMFVDRLKAAVTAPDTLFGYPADAGP